MTATVAEAPADTAVETPPGRGPDRPDSLWRNADFLKFWFGEMLSLFGNQVSTLALPLTAVIVLGASDQQVGLLRFLQLVPYLALGMIFGVWIDRLKRRTVMMVANVCRLALISVVPVLYWLDALGITPLFVIACLLGVASVAFDVSLMSYVPTLVRDPSHYVEANAKIGTTSSVADVAGPGLAGALVAALTAPVALFADALSFLVSLASLAWIRTPEPPPAPSMPKRHLIAELREGLSWVFGHRLLRPLALIGPFCNFSMIAVWTLFLLYAVHDEHLSPASIGIILSAASVGGLIGAVMSRALIARVRIGLVYAVSMSMIFLAPIGIPMAAGPKPVLVAEFIVAFFLSYAGLGVVNVVMMSLRQISTPPSLMGRMNAAFRTVLFGGGSLGALAAGFLAGAIGPRPALTIVVIGSATVLVGLFISPVSRLRRLPPAASEQDRATA